MNPPRIDASIQLPDQRKLAYAEYGDQNGTPIMLFHGLPGSRLSWGLLPDNPFPPGLRLIAPDRPGYGNSDPKPHRSLLEWAHDINALAEALDISKFAVVGVSGGGPGALACAWQWPDRIIAAGVIASPAPTNAPGVFTGMSRTNRFFMHLAWYWPWLSSLNIRFLASVIRRNPARYINTMKYKVHDVDKTLLKRHEIHNMLIRDFSEALRNSAQGMIDDMSANHGQAWGFALNQIQPPVHFWICAHDKSAPPAMGRYLGDAVPHSKVTVIPNAGHLWILAHLHEVLEAIQQVMAEYN